MKRHVLLPTMLSVLLAGAAFAVEPSLGANLGTSIEDISAALSADGYEMTKYEQEGTRIEVYAMKDGRRWELKIDPRTGGIVRSEAED